MSGCDRPPVFDVPNPRVARRKFLGGLLSATAGLSVAGGGSAWAVAVPRAAPPPPRPALGVRDKSAVTDLVAGAGLGGVAAWLVVDAASGQVLDAGGPPSPCPPQASQKQSQRFTPTRGWGPSFALPPRFWRQENWWRAACRAI